MIAKEVLGYRDRLRKLVQATASPPEPFSKECRETRNLEGRLAESAIDLAEAVELAQSEFEEFAGRIKWLEEHGENCKCVLCYHGP